MQFTRVKGKLTETKLQDLEQNTKHSACPYCKLKPNLRNTVNIEFEGYHSCSAKPNYRINHSGSLAKKS